MGCTSSAPTMSPSQLNSENETQTDERYDKSIEESNEVIHSTKESEKNLIKVLPTCDILGEPTQLARNNKSFIDTSSLDLDKDSQKNRHMTDDKEMNSEITTDFIQSEEKLSTLGEVVEKVVELYAVDNLQEKPPLEPNNEDSHDTVKVQDEGEGLNEPQNVTETEEQSNDSPEMGSPSQSESSHATRWEALADIAAELPPSLAVDPLTGQIYALAK